MVFLNKLVLDQLEFPYALFLTWFQLLIQLVCVVACGWLGKRFVVLTVIVKPKANPTNGI
jgi:GDP-fucose transporter C1